MVGDGGEIEGTVLLVDAACKAIWPDTPDPAALVEAVGILVCRGYKADAGVKREPGVQMGFTEKRLAQGIVIFTILTDFSPLECVCGCDR